MPRRWWPPPTCATAPRTSNGRCSPTGTSARPSASSSPSTSSPATRHSTCCGSRARTPTGSCTTWPSTSSTRAPSTWSPTDARSTALCQPPNRRQEELAVSDQTTPQDPSDQYAQPEDAETIAHPGLTADMDTQPDHGEQSYEGSNRLSGKKAVITGGDSGIGRAVAIAFAREGADVLIAYLNEHEDARETARLVEAAGRKAVLMAGELAEPAHCRAIVERAVNEFGRIDVLVNNAAFQMSHDSLEEIPDEEWEYTFKVNITAMFHLCKAAVKHMAPGSAIINTTSVN